MSSSSPVAEPVSFYLRFARAALSLYGGKREFEMSLPEGYDEVEIAAAFRAQGCDTTFLTSRRTIIVATHGASLL